MEPVLQVALDFYTLPRALAVAEEAVAGGADWLEAGTPLIKSVGLDAVRALRERFPDRTIVADMKTMDAGRIEVELASKAGADVVGVLAAASDATIRESLEVAENYGCKIIVDLIGVEDPVARARRAEELGAHYVGVHIAIDEQMRGVAPFERLAAVAQAVSIPVAVAGGLHSENVVQALEAGASILIVGGAITKAEDAKAATQAIRQAMATRRAVRTELFKRGTEASVREILEKVSTANLADAMHRQGEIPWVHPVFPGIKIVGRAVTVRTYPGDWAKPVEAIDVAKPGEVIVIEAGGGPEVVWGELATHSAAQKGLAGVVVYGGVRDVAEIRRLQFPVFTRHIAPTAWEPKGLGEINVPIQIGRTRIHPGDWIVGDDDGVVVVPQRQAVEIANRAMAVLEQENRYRREIDAGSTLAQVAELEKWEKR
ncbi:MAG: (Fe-S)-cluster assembly protein [Candidatus Poribacteria bacterium]|nr:MAG: (Fe-S)-cluster assembly protein [Candidatus Poribacteria bacterium]